MLWANPLHQKVQSPTDFSSLNTFKDICCSEMSQSYEIMESTQT